MKFVLSFHKGSELGHNVIRYFRRNNQRIREVIPVSVSLSKDAKLVDVFFLQRVSEIP